MSNEVDDLLNLIPISSSESNDLDLSEPSDLSSEANSEQTVWLNDLNDLELEELSEELSELSPLQEVSENLIASTQQSGLQSTPATSCGTTSLTLSGLSGPTPQTACATCRKAVWHQLQTGDVRVYCRVMHVLVTEIILECDGTLL